ncbi:10707_t:CDS:2 [Cetraspora pellucida]|uniref:10707_t:CDS:1 n=1 Tax=Cetraspora pellucida TaxID=1433469 RepID=A0ACA9L2R0_9GLOM|nr:10707_t:CDS:2 [Cetraspora pellucida]
MKPLITKTFKYRLYSSKGQEQNFQQRKKNNKKANLPSAKPLYRYRSFTYPQHGFKIEEGQLVLSQGRGYSELKINIRLHTQKKNGKKEVEVKQFPKTGKEVGIDMGLDVFCATSEGEKCEIKQFYRKQQEQLAKLTKKLSGSKHKRNKKDKTKPSQRFFKIKSKSSRLYEKIANQRADNAYKLANHFLNDYDLIAVEKLEIKKMIERRVVGKQVVEINPKNTSKTCFNCKTIKGDLELKNRIFVCACGYEADRDINAAKNIL